MDVSGDKRSMRHFKRAITFTVYIYDADGDLAAEHTTAASQLACSTCYVSVDHLNSTRMVTDQSGNVVARYDYLPFGEEIPADGTVRSAIVGYRVQADGFPLKYTGQVRDTESPLDYFNARYYSPAQGRFVATDPGNAGADLAEPQSWNGYSYALNNPMVNVDPSRLDSLTFNNLPPGLAGSGGSFGGPFSLGGGSGGPSFGSAYPWWYSSSSSGARLLPIYGSALGVIDSYQSGCTQGTIWNSALFVSDLFLVKSLATTAATAGSVAALRTFGLTRKGGTGALTAASWEHGAVTGALSRAWQTEKGAEFHHWLISQASGRQLLLPKWIVNNPLNYKVIGAFGGSTPKAVHLGIHGLGRFGAELAKDPFLKASLAVPAWAWKTNGLILSNAARQASRASDWLNCQ